MSAAPLAATTRGYPDTGYTMEYLHLGAVAVVDRDGHVLWSAGDPHAMTFTRSALKPFQALPFVRDGGPDRFGLSSAELALLCASHSGEEQHVRTVQAILGKIGCDEGQLECGCHVPLYYDSVGKPAPPGASWSALHHNCSGKHSGFLAWCRLHGVPTENYVAPGHPLQRAIRHTLAETVGMPESGMPSGMDGCSAPNYALPLSRLAQLYARLAEGEGALGPLFAAMTAHPGLVSGEARCDLAYMEAGGGDWVSKVGADAVQAIGIRSAGLGIAIKVADGASRVLQCATFSVLEQLGLASAGQLARLGHYRQPPLRNVRGSVVGDIRPLLTLHRAD